MADEMPEWSRQLIERQNQETALYRERARLVAFLAASYPAEVWTDTDAGWDVVAVNTPVGQMSWHIADADMDLFAHITQRSDEDHYDGHTTEQKYERLAELTLMVAEMGTMPERYVLGTGE